MFICDRLNLLGHYITFSCGTHCPPDALMSQNASAKYEHDVPTTSQGNSVYVILSGQTQRCGEETAIVASSWLHPTAFPEVSPGSLSLQSELSYTWE